MARAQILINPLRCTNITQHTKNAQLQSVPMCIQTEEKFAVYVVRCSYTYSSRTPLKMFHGVIDRNFTWTGATSYIKYTA